MGYLSEMCSTLDKISRPGLHDIGLLFMPDRFAESDTKNAPKYECLHEAWKAAQ